MRRARKLLSAMPFCALLREDSAPVETLSRGSNRHQSKTLHNRFGPAHIGHLMLVKTCAVVVSLLGLAGSLTTAKALTAPLDTSFGPHYNLDYVGTIHGTITVEMYGRLHVPPTVSGQTYPLIVAFHGNGEKGSNGDKHLLGKHFDDLVAKTSGTAYIYAPQCYNYGGTTGWLSHDLQDVMVGIAKILNENPKINRNRIYVTGLSLGGRATWNALMQYPIFAAGIPICGGASNFKGSSFKNLVGVPIWAFHNLNDSVVDESVTRARIKGIRDAYPVDGTNNATTIEGLVKIAGPYTSGTIDNHFYQDSAHPELMYSQFGEPNPDHNSWTRTYKDAEPGTMGNNPVYPASTGTTPRAGMLYRWLLPKTKTVGPLLPSEKILIDFGATSLPVLTGTSGATLGDDSTARGMDSDELWWNCAYGQGAEKNLNYPLKPAFFKTDGGRQTVIGISLTGTFASMTAIGGSGPLYDDAITKDAFQTGSNQTASLKIHRLAPSTSYQIGFYARATDSDGSFGRTTQYVVSGSTVEIDAYNNNSLTKKYINAVSASDGTLTVQIKPKPGGARYGMITAMTIGCNTDQTDPTIAIVAPTSGTSYTTSGTNIALSGTAGDNVGVTKVTYTSNKAKSGTCVGTTSWSCNIPLASGTNILKVTARDAAANTRTDTLTVICTRAPSTITAVADSASMAESDIMQVNVLSNDTGSDLPIAKEVVSIGTPAHGTAEIVDGEISYEPERGYFGPDAVTYTISDGSTTSTANLNITVNDTSSASNLLGYGMGPVTIGSGSASGSSRVLATGHIELTGIGPMLTTSADSLHGEFDSVSGDFTMLGRMDEFTSTSGGRFGFLVRENFTPGARCMILSMSDDGVIYTAKRTTVNTTPSIETLGGNWLTGGTWFMIQRRGNTLSAWISDDGETYTQLMTQDFPALPTTLQAGMRVTGGSGTSGRGVVGDFAIIQDTVVSTQNFDKWGSAPALSSYISSTNPHLGQYDDVSAEAGGGTWSVTSVNDIAAHYNGKLRLVRPASSGSNTGAGITRSSDGSTVQKLALSFKVSVSGVNTSQDLASIDVGNIGAPSDYNGSTPTVGVGNRLTLKGGGTNLFKFYLSGTGGGVLTGNYNADGNEIAVRWYMNQSGGTMNYQGPGSTQTSETVASGKSDLWIDGVKVLDEVVRSSTFGSATLSGFRFRTETDQPMTITLEDFDLSEVP